MIFRFLNPQGIVGIAVGFALAILLAVQTGETRHWKKKSASFEQLYHLDHTAFAATVANYRAAADRAHAADEANANRVAAEQRVINERTANEYEARLSAARAAAQRLRLQPQTAADPGARRGASVPRLSVTAGGAAQTPEQDRFPQQDALTATEQAIQLDELIKWVRRQHSVDPNAYGERRPQAAEAQAKVDNSPSAVASPPGH
jgi:hypothetical protein